MMNLPTSKGVLYVAQNALRWRVVRGPCSETYILEQLWLGEDGTENWKPVEKFDPESKPDAKPSLTGGI
jgi:hypothetical protein